MNYGFNSDVEVGEEMCHVQTEDHGPSKRVIETLAYCRGRIIHRSADDYSDLAASPEFSDDALRHRIQEHHRSVVEGLRTGVISIPPGVFDAPSASPDGIQVKLRNAKSWIVSGSAELDVKVVRRVSRQPVSDAHVEARLEGAKDSTHSAAITGASGLARLRFPLPPFGAEGVELVIRASAGRNSDEIRYSLRSKPKTPAREPKS